MRKRSHTKASSAVVIIGRRWRMVVLVLLQVASEFTGAVCGSSPCSGEWVYTNLPRTLSFVVIVSHFRGKVVWCKLVSHIKEMLWLVQPRQSLR